MIYPTISSENPWLSITPKISNPPLMKSPSFHFKPTLCFHHQDPNTIYKPVKPRTYFKNATLLTEAQVFYGKSKRSRGCEERGGFPHVGSREMSVVCGFGYWVQGFRCFPWLALNFHMAHSLSLHPSTLQLVQNSGNLPMVAKPLYGILSDALYIGGAHRIPYVSIGVILQILSWGPLALIPIAGQSLPTLMACVLLSNFGASITEVAKDALVAEYGQKHQINGLQSYALMASAAGGILGNLFGGCFLMKTSPRTMFLMFSILLSLQLANSLTIREESLGLFQLSDDNLMRSSVKESTRKKLSDLIVAIREENIYHPLTWILASILMVPSLSGSIFCYQTQCLHLDPSVIGMSRVIGQLLLLSTTVLYDRHWRKVPIRSLASAVQILYAGSLLLDLFQCYLPVYVLKVVKVLSLPSWHQSCVSHL